MRVYKTPVLGAFLIELEPFLDDRGAFVEGFVRKKLSDQGVDFDVKRVNIAKNEKAGTVRGMHFQAEPWAQAKIVMAVQGKIFDAVVDVRHKSETFGKTFSLTLYPQVNALFIARGLAHGCQALEDGASLMYLVDNDYMPANERGITPKNLLEWPLPLINVAPRDLAWPTIEEWGKHAS